MAMIDEVLGALVIGQWINCFLLCAELIAAYSYFQNYKDHWFLRGVIMFMVANDLTNSILQSVIVYSMSVTNFGDVAKLGAGTVYFSMQCLLPSTTAIICQYFLVWRFFKVSKNYFVSAFLCLPPLGAWISAVYATVALLVYTSLEDRLRVVDIGTSWLSLEASSDILISAALIVVLARYTRKTTFSETQSMLRRLILNAFTSGAITATIAIAMLLAFLISKTSNINTGFSFVLGRTYALTLLVNLLIRPKTGSGEGATTQNHSGSYGRTTGGRKQVFGVDTFKLGQETLAPADHSKSGVFRNGGVAVSREIQVQIDQPNSIGEKEGITGYESSLEREQYELEHLPAQAKRTQF